ncbi:MAG TPA: hypothetical protein VMK12_05895 [Anaeromyxobacteraceae bacterium]|nr:hypothetical protein [Anaeromyxobacteraceae bacterium]
MAILVEGEVQSALVHLGGARWLAAGLADHTEAIETIVHLGVVAREGEGCLLGLVQAALTEEGEDGV